jgi:hypothetical protein
VKKRTECRILLLMDNALGHFEMFERDNIWIVFFPPNCTRWKQPCDMGIIAALKKQYKYMYLKDVLTSTNLMMRWKIERKIRGEDCAKELQEFFTKIQRTYSMQRVMWKTLGILFLKPLSKMFSSRQN